MFVNQQILTTKGTTLDAQIDHKSYGLFEFINKASEPHHDPDNCTSVEHRADEWTGHASLDRALYLARYGWAEGYARMKGILNSLEVELQFPTIAKRIELGVVGAAPVVPLTLMGYPCDMMRMRAETSLQERKFIEIQVVGSIHCGHLGEQLYWRGATIIALCNALERSGYAVQLTLSYCSRGGSTSFVTTDINLKRSGSPMDMDSVAFFLAHPAAFRRLCFSEWEHRDKETRNRIGIYAGGTYGYPDTSIQIPNADLTLEARNIYADDLASSVTCFNDLLRQVQEKHGINQNVNAA